MSWTKFPLRIHTPALTSEHVEFLFFCQKSEYKRRVTPVIIEFSTFLFDVSMLVIVVGCGSKPAMFWMITLDSRLHTSKP